MAAHGLLDGGRAHVLAAADDEVGLAADHAQHACRVDLDDVARQHPAIRREERAVGAVVAVVAATAERSLAARLTAPRRGHVDCIVVEEPHLHRIDHPPRAAEPHVARVAQRRARERARLVRAVELEHARAGPLLEGRRARVGDSLAAREEDAQAAEVRVRERG
jgi:hypothetical protein